MGNKVKYNLSNVHYAEMTSAPETGEVSYKTPVPIPGAVSLSMEPTGDMSTFYADGCAYYVVASNTGYEGDLELAMVPESFCRDILQETDDTNKVLLEYANVETKSFALLFEFDGDVKKIRHVLYNCTASRPKIESATNEEEIEVKTEVLTIKASPNPKDMLVKARTSDATTKESYDNWYKSVYVPNLSVAAKQGGA